MKYIIFFASSFIILINFSCHKDFAKLNVDPNSISSKTAQYEKLFSSTELWTSGMRSGPFEDERTNLGYCSLLIQHMSSTYYEQGDKYAFNNEYLTAYWVSQYPYAIKLVVSVIDGIKDNPDKSNFYNIARIFKVFMFQRMTDLYGDIPYFEAGKAYVGDVAFPKYDKQEDIYEDMLKELDEAAAALDPNKKNTLNSQDIIYGGDVSKWRKFAYSEMTRLAMRMSKVAPDDAKIWVQKAVAGGVMTTNDDNAIVEHFLQPASSPANNGAAWTLVTEDNNNFKLSEAFVDFFKKHNDPRLHFYGTVSTDPGAKWGSSGYNFGDTSSSLQIGMPNGYNVIGGLVPINTAPNFPGNINNYSIPNRYTFVRPDAPTFYLTAAETQLLLAEAAQRGWISGSAIEFYNTGVKLAFSQLIQIGANWTESQALMQAENYLTANPYLANTGIQQINEQYWVAVFMDGYEAFANWRRSGYPILIPVNYPNLAINQTGGTIPRRLTYPLDEVSINTQNFNEAVSRLDDGNKMTSRMWWDKP